MPIARRDPYSGAIIFDLTPEEVKINNLEKEVNSLKEVINKFGSQTKNISKEE